jgi:ABC-2 type transport system permease protein
MSALAGTGSLTRLATRRDRVMLPSWIYLLAATALGVAYSSRATYGTLAKRVEFASSINKNPSMLALYGPVNDPASVGSVSLWKAGGIASALVGVMSILLVVRHTRGDEESGRLELVSAGVVGRYAALTAALLTALTANVVLAVVVAVGLIALGLPVAGSVAFALGWCALGVVFMGVAAITAQVAGTSRSANGLAFAALGVAYLIRATGDAVGHDGPQWLKWLSPFGWASYLHPYAGDRFWVLSIVLVFCAVCVGAAFWLVNRRDLGTGLLPDRLGPAAASRSLRNPLALAWRLQRGSLLAWTAGFVVYGAAIGGVIDSAENMLGGKNGRDLLAKLGGSSTLIDAFLNTITGVMALAASAYAIQAILRLRSEETGQLAEPILATRVGRLGWAASHITIAALGSAVLMCAQGFVVGLMHGLRSHDVATQVPRVLGSAVAQLPAVWVLAGLTVALYGLAPRLAAVAWGALGLFLLLGELGPLLKLKQWAMDISPYTHSPKLPETMQATPLVLLIAIAAALTALGLTGLRRRDIG